MSEPLDHGASARPTTYPVPAVLPEASGPGQVGWRRLADGRLAVPWGVNVQQFRHSFYSVVQRRRDWDAERAVGGRYTPQAAMFELSRCARCEVCIGYGYRQTELYTAVAGIAVAARGTRTGPSAALYTPKLVWRDWCGRCAVDQGLAFGYCLVASHDWSEGAQELALIPADVRALKALAVERELLPAWNAAAKPLKRAWAARHPEQPFPRLAALQRFAAAFSPTPLTLTALRATAEQARARWSA